MENLERIVMKGPDNKLVRRAYELMFRLDNSDEQLLVANLLRRHLSRWLEISGTYAERTGDRSYQSRDPYFGPVLWNMPRVLTAIVAQALLSSRPFLSSEMLPETLQEYSLTATALEKLTHRGFAEWLKSFVGSVSPEYKRQHATNLTRESDLASRIYLHT